MSPARSLRRTAVVLGLALAAALLPAPAPVGAADDPPPGFLDADVTLPFRDADAIVVDPTTGRVVVAGEDEVDVYSPDLQLRRRFPDMFGVTHLAVSGGDVYALLANSGEIARIRPATLAVTGRWRVTGVNGLHGLAVTNGHVWTTGFDLLERGVLASLDPSDGGVRTLVNGIRLDLTSSPTRPGVLIGMSEGLSTIRLFRYAAGADGIAVPRRSVPYDDLANAADMGFTSDGSRLRLVTGGGTYRVHTMDPMTLEEVEGLLPLNRGFPRAVEPSPVDPDLVLAGSNGGLDHGDLRLLRSGTDEYVAGWEASWGLRELVEGGLAFAPDGSRAYALRERTHPSQTDPADIVILDWRGPTPAVTPRVIGTAGGGLVEVRGIEGPDAAISIGGQRVLRSPTPGSVATVLTPAHLDVGPVRVGATSRSGSFKLAPQALVVAGLGPHAMGTTFTDQMARDAWGRPATASELLTEEARMLSGVSSQDVTLGMIRSGPAARLRAPLVRLYRAVFLRPPDASGFAYWLGRLERGTSLAAVGQAMTSSAEFRQRYGTLDDSAFVDRVYSNVLGRSPDAAGRQHWLGRLRSGTSRGQVVTLMSQSAEHVRTTAPLVDVVLLHHTLLRRMPTASERDRFLPRDPAETALTLLYSPEYLTRF